MDTAASSPVCTVKRRKRVGVKRRVAGLALILLGLAVAAAWFTSKAWQLSTSRGYLRYRVYSGLFELSIPIVAWQDATVWHLDRNQSFSGPFSTPIPANWAWRTVPEINAPTPKPIGVDLVLFSYTYYPASGTKTIVIVLWPVPLALWTVAALFMRSGARAKRHAETGRCYGCGYDLGGIPSVAPCPECGQARLAAARR